VLNQTIKRVRFQRLFRAARYTGAMNVASGDAGPGSATTVFVFDADRGFGAAGNPDVCADGPRCWSSRRLRRQIHRFQDSVGLDGEGRVASEDPAAVVSGADAVVMVPSPIAARAARRNPASSRGITRISRFAAGNSRQGAAPGELRSVERLRTHTEH
jgi:hypothetical protein